MEKIIFNDTYFNIKDTLECGQVFRFYPHEKGYLVYSKDKCAYCYNENGNAIVECNEIDKEYFYNYFDLDNDYDSICSQAKESKYEVLRISSELGKGIRILNQDLEETLFSFMISQNNNIPRIKSIIEKLCYALGEKKEFLRKEYYVFPTSEAMANKDIEFFKSIGLGYRAGYVKKLAEAIVNGFDVNWLKSLSTDKIREELIKVYGVGEKVADCVTLFGYHRGDTFPVDTWIEKLYKENFNGKLTDRKKISKWLVGEFGEKSGYYQQYLFYYKRSLEKKGDKKTKK